MSQPPSSRRRYRRGGGEVLAEIIAPYAFEGISTWLQRLDRFATVVEHTKGDR